VKAGADWYAIFTDLEHFQQKCEAVLRPDNALKQTDRAFSRFEEKRKYSSHALSENMSWDRSARRSSV
jgi:hypothetical protein